MEFPSLVIFDMDGLMFDTEKITSQAWMLSGEHYGFEIDQSIIGQLTGLTNTDIMNRVSEIYGEHAPVHEWRSYMRAEKSRLIEENMYLPEFKKEGLDSLLVFLKENQVKTAVASSSEKTAIQKYLQATNIGEYIDFCVSGDEVVKGKPNPEIFLTACKKAGVQPSDALVLEDSPAGIRAAYSAEIPAFFVPDTVPGTPELEQMAARVFVNLTEVEEYLRTLL